MKKLKNLLLLLAVGSTLAVSNSSCKKDDPAPTPTPKTITDIVSNDANFSILKAAVVRAELAGALSTGSLTVFAPDNAAFAAAGITLNDVNTMPVADLTNILKYHVLSTKVLSTGVPASDAVTSLLGTKIFASKNANGVFVNGIKVKTADVAASNGVIHVISSVLIPPTKTIAQLATDTPELSFLLAAVVRAGLADAVAGPGKFTVFAPINQAFIDAGFIDINAINTADATAVANIVSGHVLPTNVFASDLIQGQTAPTLKSGVSLVIGTTPPSVKISTSTQPASNIIVPSGVNIVATNGVVHLINRVILP